jgi:hypothetical protein
MKGPRSAYSGILRHPSRTALALAEGGSGQRQAMVIVCLLGVLMPFPTLYQAHEEGFSIALERLPGLLLGGVLGGLFCWVLLSWLYRNFSRMLGGSATVREIRIGLGWGLFPALLLFAVGTLFSLFWIHFAYESAGQGMEPKAAYMTLLGPLAVLFFLVLLYAYAVLLLALSGVARLGVMKAFFALVITMAVSFFPLTLLLQLIVGGE